jgi:alkanesulfonate monooxygenase SsuD/methylene tetrahydromethanopterin reductase-like flavin-dependent oxidoreductase (luciferase family)
VIAGIAATVVTAAIVVATAGAAEAGQRTTRPQAAQPGGPSRPQHWIEPLILVPYLTPGGLDEFVDKVVPLLQERGSFRTEYEGTTLRDHLGLRQPVWKA